MLASAQTIRKLQPITPFEERTVFAGMTYGLGPAGYDIRLDQDVKLAPGEFSLASAMEYFTMPNNLIGVVHDKSSLARKGLSVFNTVIECSWFGFLTLELKNQGHHDILLHAGTPIAQVLFHLLDEPTVNPYNGRYQNQPSGPQRAIEADETSK